MHRSGSDSASLEELGLSALCPDALSHLQHVVHVWTFTFNSAQSNPDALIHLKWLGLFQGVSALWEKESFHSERNL